LYDIANFVEAQPFRRSTDFQAHVARRPSRTRSEQSMDSRTSMDKARSKQTATANPGLM
jgi:hypothetical protein